MGEWEKKQLLLFGLGSHSTRPGSRRTPVELSIGQLGTWLGSCKQKSTKMLQGEFTGLWHERTMDPSATLSDTRQEVERLLVLPLAKCLLHAVTGTMRQPNASTALVVAGQLADRGTQLGA